MFYQHSKSMTSRWLHHIASLKTKVSRLLYADSIIILFLTGAWLWFRLTQWYEVILIGEKNSVETLRRTYIYFALTERCRQRLWWLGIESMGSDTLVVKLIGSRTTFCLFVIRFTSSEDRVILVSGRESVQLMIYIRAMVRTFMCICSH